MTCQDPTFRTSSSSLVRCPQRSTFQDLTIITKLNQANFGVFLAFSPSHNRQFALKVFPYAKENPNPYFINEVLFSNLRHSSIISPIYSQSEKIIHTGGKQTKISFTVMELAPYGDFFEVLITRKISFDEKLTRTYFHQLINGLEFLFSKKISHLDLKPENLLIGKNFQLKITDFDHSAFQGKVDIPTKGTLFYRAPEIIDESCTNLEAADVYSAGIILFLFKCGGVLPHVEHRKFEGVDLSDLLYNHNEMFWNKHCEVQRKPASFFSEEFKSLFNAMTKLDPNERPKLVEIKNYAWFNAPIYSDEELSALMRQKLSC